MHHSVFIAFRFSSRFNLILIHFSLNSIKSPYFPYSLPLPLHKLYSVIIKRMAGESGAAALIQSNGLDWLSRILKRPP